MRKGFAVLGLLLGVGLAVGQEPATDGLVWTTDDTGKSYPVLFAVKGPPWAIKGKGSVNLSKYPNGVIASSELSVQIVSRTKIDPMPGKYMVLANTKAKVTDGKTFEIESPKGGIGENPVTVIVNGLFKTSPMVGERGVILEGIAGS